MEWITRKWWRWLHVIYQTSSACSITALTVQGRKILFCSKNSCKTSLKIIFSKENNISRQLQVFMKHYLRWALEAHFLSKSFASLYHTFNAIIYLFRSWSRWSVVVELELIDTYMVSVLAHIEKSSQRSFARTSNFFTTMFCRCVVCSAVMFQRRVGKQFQSWMSFFVFYLFCFFTIHI